MREAERQKEEAIEYAKKVNTEAQQLKNRFENLDSNYTAEFEKRVTINIEKTLVIYDFKYIKLLNICLNCVLI